MRSSDISWTVDRDDVLMELASLGRSFSQIGNIMGITKNAAMGRFDRLRKSMGPQAI